MVQGPLLAALAALTLLVVVAWALRARVKRASVASPAEGPSHVAGPPEGDAGAVPAVSRIVPRRSQADIPSIAYEEDAEIEATMLSEGAMNKLPSHHALPIVYDPEAECDEPTHAEALFLTVGYAKTDRGMRRPQNEDNLLVDDVNCLYAVADGMGGHRGGATASRVSVETLHSAFADGKVSMVDDQHSTWPKRAAQLATAMQLANEAVLAKAKESPELKGMGTTLSVARFSPNKQRLYVAHVGDSRVYRCRAGKLDLMTTDHTMGNMGVQGDGAAMLSRAVGVWPRLPFDMMVSKPEPGDVYLVCSDGLSKMLASEEIRAVLGDASLSADAAVEKLVERANAAGGLDNITAIVIRVMTSDSKRMRVA